MNGCHITIDNCTRDNRMRGSAASGCLYYSLCKICLAATKKVFYNEYEIHSVLHLKSFIQRAITRQRQQLMSQNDSWHENRSQGTFFNTGQFTMCFTQCKVHVESKSERKVDTNCRQGVQFRSSNESPENLIKETKIQQKKIISERDKETGLVLI